MKIFKTAWEFKKLEIIGREDIDSYLIHKINFELPLLFFIPYNKKNNPNRNLEKGNRLKHPIKTEAFSLHK